MTLTQPDWVERRPYQRQAIDAWLDNDGRGIFHMATGTGKTVTALCAVTTAVDALGGQCAVVVAVPYQHLVDQWAEDIRDFGVNPILAYKSRRQWQPDLERAITEFNAGARETVVAVTTHDTFGMDSFQTTWDRLVDSGQLLIADEVHHMGAPHRREALPEDVPLRLGLSATPDRFYDEEGTTALHDYFGQEVFTYGLAEAIENGALCPYYYVPHVVELTPAETDEYLELSNEIASLMATVNEDIGDADLQEHKNLQQLLFQRARLVGAAENKLQALRELVNATGSLEHALVYCGDGSVSSEVTGQTERQVDAAVSMLREDLGYDVGRFTARESQTERERLLDRFERGETEALVAIRCLDEGVDVPATKVAFMLASTSNPRQFVQRRGRILRPHEDKRFAVIHDMVTVPRIDDPPATLPAEQFNVERKLVRKELQRVTTFTEHARNHPDADIDGVPTGDTSLSELRRAYNLRDE